MGTLEKRKAPSAADLHGLFEVRDPVRDGDVGGGHGSAARIDNRPLYSSTITRGLHAIACSVCTKIVLSPRTPAFALTEQQMSKHNS